MARLPISRRTLLQTGAALPVAAAVGAPTVAQADGHSAPQNAIQNTFALGEFQVSTLLAGSRVVDENIQGIFGQNVLVCQLRKLLTKPLKKK